MNSEPVKVSDPTEGGGTPPGKGGESSLPPLPPTAGIPLNELVKEVGEALTSGANQLRASPPGLSPAEGIPAFQLVQANLDLALNVTLSGGKVMVAPAEPGQTSTVSHITLTFNPLPITNTRSVKP